MTLRRLHVALDFGDGPERPIARLGWDAAARHAVAEWDQRAVEEMFRRMVFNIRTLNRDDHLKNHAFLMDRDGIWHLAPAYDLSFSRGPGGEHTLLVGGEGRRPGQAHIEHVAVKAGIKPRRMTEIITQVDAAVADWMRFAKAAEVPVDMQRVIKEATDAARSWLS